MKNLKDIILEKLKVTKSSGSKMPLKEFAKERQSLNYPKNYVKLTSSYKMTFTLRKFLFLGLKRH